MTHNRLPFALWSVLLFLGFLMLAGCGTSSHHNTNPPTVANPQATFVYVNNADSSNVSGYQANQQSAAVAPISGSPFAVPSFPIDIKSSGNFVFVESTGVNALNPSDFVITTYKADPMSGSLTQSSTLNVASAINGGIPAHVAVDPSGKFLYLSVISGINGSIVGFSIDPGTGALTPLPGGVFSPGAFTASEMVISPNGRFLFAAAAEGSGAPPTFGVQTISRDPNSGSLSPASVPIASDPHNDTISGLAVAPSGNVLVGTGTSTNLVLSWSIDPNTGALTPVSQVGQLLSTTEIAPMGVAIDTSGRYALVTNSGSSDVSVYTISSTGALSEAPGSPFAAGSAPFAITVNASGTLVFVANIASNNMSVYQLNPSSGALAQVPGSPFPLGAQSKLGFVSVATIN